MNSNIFSFKLGDATAYLIFYIVILVMVTYISLRVQSADIVSRTYCYVTILISVLNGIYDAANRWKRGIKCRCNTKLFVIFLSNGIIILYCLYIIFYVLIIHKIGYRFDAILLAYLGTCSVAIWDAAAVFLKDMSLKDAIRNNGIGGVEG